ncbi:recombinase [Clostridia bacterium]|nr:recombinase [Clostridia bacterium]
MNRQQNEKINYLYGRLSKEDERSGTSCSIENQERILTKYAQDNGFTPCKFVYDDGVSGTVFSRPGLDEVLAEVRAGRVSTVIIKDASRIGRDVVEVGLLKRTFDEYDVRFIAAEDNFDSARGFDIMSIFRDVFNEFFVADTSKKIRAVWQSKGKSGERLAVIPIYGYRKGEDGKTLVIDEESAAVVRRIFKMCTEGINAAEIARVLMSERLLNPSAYKYEKGFLKKPRPLKDPYLWNTTTIHKILDAPEYIGQTVNFKTWSKSYKDNKCRFNPPEKRLVFENTHEPIIDEVTWQVVRKMRQTKRRAPRYGNVGLFTGLVYCSDCQSKLYYQTREIRSKTATRYEGAYSCAEYRKAVQYQGKRSCTCHYISETNLTEIVLENLRGVLKFAATSERQFAKMAMDKSHVEQKREIAAKKRFMEQKRKRVTELDTLFERLYEDNASGKISNERFAKLSAKYEQEQADLRTEVDRLEIELGAEQSKLGDVDKFLAAVRKCADIHELTPAIANEFIDRIIVHEPEKARGNRVQKVDIIYNGVGAVDLQQLESLKIS